MSHDELPFREVRSTQPLSDSDLASIRASVLEKVTTDRRTFLFSPARLAFASAIVIFIAAAVFFTTRRDTAVPMAPRPAVTAASQPQQPVAPAVTAHAPQEAATSVRTVAPVTIATPVVVTAAGHDIPPSHPRRVHRSRPEPTLTATVARTEPVPVRIELATANPDIRIIWITNASIQVTN